MFRRSFLQRSTVITRVFVIGIGLAFAQAHAQVCSVPSFHPAPTVQVGNSPQYVLIRDLSGDGINDLATANQGSDDVSILLGNGDGTFTQATGSPISTLTSAGGNSNGSRPGGLAAADFNQDGVLDLAVALRNSNELMLLYGSGGGAFAIGSVQTAGPSGSSPRHVTAGDFDSDGNADVAIGLNGSYVDGGVAVFLGDGVGTLSAAPGSPLIVSGGEIFGLVAGHFTGTAPLDLVLVDRNHDKVLILQGAGDGSFAQVADMTVVANAIAEPFEVATADVNRDGLDDLLVANHVFRANGGVPVSVYNDVAVLLQQASHTFAAPVHVAAGGDIISVASTDFNADHLPDFAVANAAFTFDGSVRFGDGSASFAGAGPTSYSAGGNPYNVAVGVLNDGYGPGFVVVNQPSNTLSVYLNDCDAIFRSNFDFP